MRAILLDGRTQCGLPKRDIGLQRILHSLIYLTYNRVFHRFYRVDHEKVRTRKGTGLGLFVVSQLVRNLGGSIRAESDGVGNGSRFVLRLPVTPARAS